MVRPNSGALRGTIPLFTFPTGGNVVRVGYAYNITITAPNVRNVPAAWTGDYGIGTGAIRSGNTTLAGDRVDIVASTATTAASRVVTLTGNQAGLTLTNVGGETYNLNLLGDRGTISASVDVVVSGFIRATYIVL